MKYFKIKDEIKERIRMDYDTMKSFLDSHPELNMNESQLSIALNPSRGANLTTLTKISDCLGIELTTRRKPIIKTNLRTA